jgi:hypothetical protein
MALLVTAQARIGLGFWRWAFATSHVDIDGAGSFFRRAVKAGDVDGELIRHCGLGVVARPALASCSSPASTMRAAYKGLIGVVHDSSRNEPLVGMKELLEFLEAAQGERGTVAIEIDHALIRVEVDPAALGLGGAGQAEGDHQIEANSPYSAAL